MLYLLVFLSGAAALIYEVVWARQLSTFLGITTHAHTVVLASFMAGLAIGSWLFGRQADRCRRPLRLYAGLEAGIGVYGLITLWLVPALQAIYVTLAPDDPNGWLGHGIRLFAAAVAVLPAAVLMGGTLPALIRGLHAERSLSRTVAGAYGVNTLGAASGALACGYSLLPAAGVQGSLLVAVGLNLSVAAGVFSLSWAARARPARSSRPDSAGDPAPPDISRGPLLFGFALSGAAALALQLAWIRALTQVIGSSVYAFSLTTAAYLVGLAAGSLAAAVAIRRGMSRQATVTAAAGLEVGVALSVLAGLPLLGKLPELFLAGYRMGVQESFPALQLFLFAMISAVMIVPTALLGAILPLLTSVLPRGRSDTGLGVGIALAANSLGTVAGTLLSGLVLISLLGAEGVLRLAAIASAAVGGLFWLARSPGTRSLRRTAVAVAGVAGLAAFSTLIPRWDRVLMTSGPFINAARFVDVPPGRELREWLRRRSRILYYEEGIEATVSVRDVGGERLLVINGKTDGSREGDRKTQLALAHLPLLAHPDPERVLVVGLGTGMSAAAGASYSEIDNLTIIELSPEVVEAAKFFRQENEDVLLDPRVALVQADARNYLLTTDAPFDVILSEPSNPWIHGVSNLFTSEYFELASSRLAADGVMAQWFQTYGMSTTDLQSVVRSFSDTFSNVSVWSPQLGDLLLLGSHRPHDLSLTRLTDHLSEPRAGAQLESIGLDDPTAIARMFLLDDRAARSFASSARPNTDNRPRVEFNAPRSMYSETTLDNLAALIAHLGDRSPVVPLAGLATVTDGTIEALGISVKTPPGATARAEWRVSWTAFISADDEPAPVGVGNRPMIVIDSPSLMVEIERGWSSRLPTAENLLELARARSRQQPSAIGSVPLASGEDAVWLTFTDPAESRAIVAWSCGASHDRHDRYLAVAAGRRHEPLEIVRMLSAAVSCKTASW